MLTHLCAQPLYELVSCQPPFEQPDVDFIDGVATRRCKTLMAVDDSLSLIIDALDELDELGNTCVGMASLGRRGCVRVWDWLV